MAKSNAKGRSKTSRFVQMDHKILYSPAYRGLSTNARALLIELIGLFNGINNGSLFLSTRDAERLLGVTNDETIRKAFYELVSHGLVQATERGSFSRKAPHATAWRLTFLHAFDRAPTNEHRNWRPSANTRAAKRLARYEAGNLRSRYYSGGIPESRTDAAIRVAEDDEFVHNAGTATLQTDEIAVLCSAPETRAHVICHREGRPRASVSRCKYVRSRVRHWLEVTEPGRTQRILARRCYIGESALSRFLNDPHGRRTLPVEQLDALDRVTRVPTRLVSNSA